MRQQPRFGGCSSIALEAQRDSRLHTPFEEITLGLQQQPACIAPKYFYDQRGSELFEAITRLPEYYPTRTEAAILRTHGSAIAQAVGAGRTVVELGAGNCEKAMALCRLVQPACFVGVDISAEFLEAAVQGLRAEFPGVRAHAVAGDLTRGVTLPEHIARDGRLVFYPGSSIGNFDPPQAGALLAQMHALAGEGGALLIGIDLPKDVAVLEAAYDDAAGVTAAFNRNVLAHVNRIIGSDFVPDRWQHRAFFNTAASRIEMHLEAAADVQIRWPGGSRAFARGERIHTENSYKYPLAVFTDMLRGAGFAQVQAWTDDRDWFALVLARA